MSASIENRTAMFSFIEQWQKSGLSQKDFCSHHRIKTHCFYYWYKQYRQQCVASGKGLPVGKFVEVKAEHVLPAEVAIEMLLVGGHRIVFNQPVPASFIKAILS